MFTRFQTSILAGLCLIVIALIPINANAQRFDKGTTIDVNHSFQVPGKTLPAGKYVIRLMDIAGTRNVVQILSADEKKSFAIALAIPDYRLKAPEKTNISFYEFRRGAPAPLHAWFYPGSNFGVEFVYPKTKAVEIATVSGEHVIATTSAEPATEPTPSELKSEPIIVIEPSGQEAEVAAVHPEPEVQAAPAEPVLTAQAEAPTETVKKLPRTATPLPLIALTGLLAAGAATALRAIRKVRG